MYPIINYRKQNKLKLLDIAAKEFFPLEQSLFKEHCIKNRLIETIKPGLQN